MATKAKATSVKKAATPKGSGAKPSVKTTPVKKAKDETKGPGKIEQIIALHKKGKTNAEIVEAGFNKTTVAIQVSKHKKSSAK